MRFRNLQKWNDPSQLESLVFLAQMLEEMLFDFSLDTYKPSAMNSSLLCIEALHTINDIEKGIIKRPNLEHISEELAENLRNDEVAQSLLTLNIEKVISIIKNKTAPLPDVKTILELLWSELVLSAYKQRNEKLLVEAILNGCVKSKIKKLVQSYVTTLKNYGFHSKYLYDTTMSFFYFGSNQISSTDIIKEYISLFNTEPKKFVAIYRASKIFEEISDSCQSFEMIVSKEAGEHAETLKTMGHLLKNQDEVYVIVNDIDALEYYSARQNSDNRMELVGTLLTLFHHKEHPSWAKDCVVIEIESGKARKVNKSINPMLKCIDLKPEKASKRLNSLINHFSLNNKSLPKFFRSAELHSQALNSDSSENQIINLWIALESLIPPKGEKAKIETLIESVLPFLNLAYIDRLLDRLISDIYNWNQRVLKETLKNIPGSTLKSKFVKLLVLDEYKQERNIFMDSFKDFYLLRNRFFSFQNDLSSPKNIKKVLDRHTKRLQWQIRRIYRARNLVVHKGTPPTYINILIENIHDYLDIVMATLVRLASDGVKIDSIEQGFKYIELNYEAYYEALASCEEKLTKENIDELLFKYTI